jgi:glycine/serine hydroxymethyltransferase
MGVAEMIRIAELIDRALTRSDEATLGQVKGEVEEMTSVFPLYQATPRPSRVRRTA